MNYKPLKSRNIKLGAKAELELDAGAGTILIPPNGVKVFLHWLNENGKLVSTYTLTYSTLVKNKLKIINGSDKDIDVQAIDSPE